MSFYPPPQNLLLTYITRKVQYFEGLLLLLELEIQKMKQTVLKLQVKNAQLNAILMPHDYETQKVIIVPQKLFPLIYSQIPMSTKLTQRS